MRETIIVAARVAAAHEGIAELVVTLEHANGGRSEVPLDHLGASALLAACGASGPDELEGHSWRKVRDALAVSWNRYTGVGRPSGPERGWTGCPTPLARRTT